MTKLELKKFDFFPLFCLHNKCNGEVAVHTFAWFGQCTMYELKLFHKTKNKMHALGKCFMIKHIGRAHYSNFAHSLVRNIK